MRIAALSAVLLLAGSATLAGCATVSAVDAPTALNGHELDTALNLYGPWDEKVILQGRPHYVWRRAVVLNAHTYYCELRAEVGYREAIKASIVEGYPAACGLFTVQYVPEVVRTKDSSKPTTLAARKSSPNFRPVGSATETASTGASQDASARTR